MSQFEFNEHNICINPEVVYTSEGNYNLAWIYYELTICQNENGDWGYGVSHCGGGFGADNRGLYTRVQAIEEGFEILKERAEKCVNSPIDTNNTKEIVKASNDFLLYLKEKDTPKQLSIF